MLAKLRCWWYAEGIIEIANAAAVRLHGCALDEMQGRAIYAVLGAWFDDAAYQKVYSCLLQGKAWEGAVNIERDGEPRILERRFSPVLDAEGQLLYQIVMDRDMTDEKHRAEQLEHTQRLESLGILAGGIAHDFNNILTAIMGNVALVQRRVHGDATATKQLERIMQASQRAADLCRQMLAYSGKGMFVVKVMNISALLDDMKHLLAVSMGKDIAMKYHLEPSLPLVKMDVAQIQQVILNFITNANEAIGEQQGEIVLRTGVMDASADDLKTTVTGEILPEGRYVYLQVSDTGGGMDAAMMARIFDPFYTTKFMGRGLGMSAVLGIVRGHHGGLFVTSEQGKGSTFKMLLPVLDDGTDAAVVDLQVSPWSKRKSVVLVVDDEESIRDVTVMMLEDMGYETLTAVDGLDAVQVYREHVDDIALVLLDMTMPKMDGRQCFDELLAIHAEVKVILSSGYNEEEVTESFAEHGLAGFLHKPYSPEDLQKMMAKQLPMNLPMDLP